MRGFGTVAVAGSASVTPPRISLPAVIPVPEGETLQLFHRSVVETPMPLGYTVEVSASVGSMYPRYWEYTPGSGSAGDKTITYRVVDISGQVIATKSCIIRVYSTASMTSDAKTVLCVGDSLTAAGIWPVELKRRIADSGGTPAGLGLSNVTFVGNKTSSGVNYLGYGGWRWSYYRGTSGTSTRCVVSAHDKTGSDIQSKWSDGVNNWLLQDYGSGYVKLYPDGHSSSMPASGTLTHVSGGANTGDVTYTATSTEPSTPLWDPGAGGISFTQFCSNYGIATINYAVFLLGWNQGVDGTPDADFTASGWADTLADARIVLDRLKADFPGVQALICGIQCPSLNGGLGANYGSNSMSQVYRVLKAVTGLNDAYQGLCAESAYSAWCRYVPVACQFDSEYNMPVITKAVNTRSSTTETLGSNGVHPGTEGYKQIADAAYRSLCPMLTV